MRYTVNYLKEYGFNCSCSNVPYFENSSEFPDNATVIILPYPSFRNGYVIGTPIIMSELFHRIPEGSTLIGGNLPNIESEKRRIVQIDVSKHEDFVMKNAVLTAECALGEAITRLPCSIAESEILIIGYGRIGKALADLMKKCKARVTVSARKAADLSWIRAQGMNAVSVGNEPISWQEFRCIFNTVPYNIIDPSVFDRLPSYFDYFELASSPGGLPASAIEKLNKQYHALPGLPGKLAPEQAGKIYAQEIGHILGESV